PDNERGSTRRSPSRSRGPRPKPSRAAPSGRRLPCRSAPSTRGAPPLLRAPLRRQHRCQPLSIKTPFSYSSNPSMSMRGRRRASTADAAMLRHFAWECALVATLRHSTLPWDESLATTPLAEARSLGTRDRLSLLAQFAAHQALLQFAGIA